jgi:NADH:ubiquinone reductase (H+-translocating)
VNDRVPHVIIIGGGFGGLDAARAFAGAPVRATLLDRHNYHLFQPLLYQVATASLSPADIASPIRWILRRQKNVTVLLANVVDLDVAAKQVILDSAAAAAESGVKAAAVTTESGVKAGRALAYDFLIVATGAAHSYFGRGEWAARAPGLKTLDDALEIRRRVLLAFEAAERQQSPDEQRRLLTFVIVGGGPTGVELAGALAEIARQSLRQDFRNIRPESARILLLEGTPHLLNSFPQPLRDAARGSLERLGVDVRTSTIVTGVDETGVTFRAQDAAEERLPAQTVLWAAGVEASPIAKALGVPRDRAVKRSRRSPFRAIRRSSSPATSAP